MGMTLRTLDAGRATHSSIGWKAFDVFHRKNLNDAEGIRSMLEFIRMGPVFPTRVIVHGLFLRLAANALSGQPVQETFEMRTRRALRALLALGMFVVPGNVAWAVFLPTDLPGNILWLDAADPLTVHLSGTDVDRWDDKSGQLNHASLGSGGTQHPSYATGVLGGKNVLRFGGNDYLDLAANMSPGTMFAVVKRDGGEVLQRIICDSGYNHLGIYGSNYEARFGYFPGPIIGPATSTFRIIAAGGDGVTAFTAYDGVVTDRGTENFGNSGSYSVGRPRGYNGQYLTGDIAEIIVYNRVLSRPEHNVVGDYLEQKYGLNTAYDVPEPCTPVLLGFGAAMGMVVMVGRRRPRKRTD